MKMSKKEYEINNQTFTVSHLIKTLTMDLFLLQMKN